jgi:hypothetical protein
MPDVVLVCSSEVANVKLEKKGDLSFFAELQQAKVSHCVQCLAMTSN